MRHRVQRRRRSELSHCPHREIRCCIAALPLDSAPSPAEFLIFITRKMKKYPYPDKKIGTKEDVDGYLAELFHNALHRLNIEGYIYYFLYPGDLDYYASPSAGLTILVKYPYKKFYVSIQQNSLDKMYAAKSGEPVWKSIERSVFHECLHIILWQLEEVARKRWTTPDELNEANEAATDHLANVIYPLIEELRTLKNGKIKQTRTASPSRARRTASKR